jgi:hypothetical protein
MATRSRIAIENPDKTVTSIYCHWDGYVEHNGNTLQNHFTDRSKVEELIALGDISTLHEEIYPTEKHSFDNPQNEVTVAYHRDRGDIFRQEQHDDVEDFFNGDIEEYGYLFTLEGRWLVCSGGPVVELERALNGEDVL